MRKITVSFILMLSIFMMGCPKNKATLEKAEATSKKVATYANEAVNITRDLFREKIITPEQTLQMTELFGFLAKGGVRFDQKVSDLKAYYAENPDEKPDSNTLTRLAEYFRSDVIIRFVEVLEYLKIIQPNERLKIIIQTIKTAIIIVADALNVGQETRVDLAGV